MCVWEQTVIGPRRGAVDRRTGSPRAARQGRGPPHGASSGREERPWTAARGLLWPRGGAVDRFTGAPRAARRGRGPPHGGASGREAGPWTGSPAHLHPRATPAASPAPRPSRAQPSWPATAAQEAYVGLRVPPAARSTSRSRRARASRRASAASRAVMVVARVSRRASSRWALWSHQALSWVGASAAGDAAGASRGGGRGRVDELGLAVEGAGREWGVLGRVVPRYRLIRGCGLWRLHGVG
jgi:hypothetical protein